MTKNEQFIRWVPFVLSFLFLISCSNQRGSDNSDIESIINEYGDSTHSQTDTTLHLKFKTPVRAILEDSKGNFWFGSWQEGVCRFDGRRFTYFTEEDGLSHNQVRNIHEDSKGVIWFETGKGISRYNGEKITTHTDRDYSSRDNWKSKPDDLWFKGDESSGFTVPEGDYGVYRYDGKKFTFLEFLIPDERINDKNMNFAVTTAVVKGRNGKLWFGTYAAAIGYDPLADRSGGKVFTIIDRQIIGLSQDHPHLGIRTIFEDSKGNLWMGDNGAGVFLYNGTTTLNFTEKHGLSKKDAKGLSPSLSRVFSIGEDNAGNIWFGTFDSGVWRYKPSVSPHSGLLERQTGGALTNFSAKDGLTTQGVVAIYKDNGGDLWFGGESVFQFNGESFDKKY